MQTTIPPRRFAVAIPVTPPVGADDMATLGAATEKDYIKITIPTDGTAAAGGNEQGAFIRTAPHNLADSLITADADIVFRSMKIDIRDYEPIYP